MPKRRGGAAMAEVLEEEQPEPSFSDPSSIELDDEHIAEEIKEVAASKGKEEHDEGEEDDEEDDKEDDKESDEDEMEGSEPKVKRGRGQEAVRKKKKKWSRGKRRTSAVHFFFEKGDSDGVFVCKLHAFMPKGSGHPQHVRQGGPGTSNLLSHARCYSSKERTTVEREGRSSTRDFREGNAPPIDETKVSKCKESSTLKEREFAIKKINKESSLRSIASLLLTTETKRSIPWRGGG
jgi:hypothetical protein